MGKWTCLRLCTSSVIALHSNSHINQVGQPKMKITEVITHQLLVNVDEPFTSSRGWYYKTKGALVSRRASRFARHGPSVSAQPFTSSNSTSNINVAFGGMAPPAPRAP